MFLQHFNSESEYGEKEYRGILESVCTALNTRLIGTKSINSWYSGSTGIIVLLHNNYIVCANVGDSRAGIVKYNPEGSCHHMQMLSKDHTPADPLEKDRIIKSGGKVMACQGNHFLNFLDQQGNPIGPLRVWDQSEEGPGLMMSRSFGDQAGHKVGMCALPGMLCS